MKLIASIVVRFVRGYASVKPSHQVNMEDNIKSIFYAAVKSVKPCELITKNRVIKLEKQDTKEFLKIKNGLNEMKKFDVTSKNIQLVGFGKGVLAISAELEGVLGEKLSSGILSVPVGALKTQPKPKSTKIKVIEGASQNIPDENSLRAAIEIKTKALSLTNDDILLVLITGGGSALLSLPIAPITLEEKSMLIKQLSRAGATINELNTVRIAISQVKGGKLAAMAKNAHHIISLIISDVINDPLDLIASGPTVARQTPSTSPLEILEKFNLLDTLPHSILNVIRKNEENQDIPPINNSDVFLIGNNRVAIEAAMDEARSFNLFPVFLSRQVQGNVVDVSQAFFELAVAVKHFSSSDEFRMRVTGIAKTLSAQSNFINDLVAALEATNGAGVCIISGGETTVTVSGDGRGGRNQELALRFTQLCLEANTSSLNDLLFLSAGTDGIDGNNEAAGALGGSRILPKSIDSATIQDYILRNDSFTCYRNLFNDRYQITIGHTGTNVMDLMILLIIPRLP